MEEKNEQMEWNVYYYSINSREIKTFNIFNHGGFHGDLIKIAKKYKDDREKFEEEVRSSLMYYFWSKCEWEIILTEWPPRENSDQEKVDAYGQVMMNWKIFINYLWENGKILRSKRFATLSA